MTWRLVVGGGSRSNGGSRRITEERGGLLNDPGRLDGSDEPALVSQLLDTIGSLNQENEHLKKDVAEREQEKQLKTKALAASLYARVLEHQQHQQEVAQLEQFVKELQSALGVAQAQLAKQLVINEIDKQEYDDNLAAKEAELTRLRSQNEKLLAQLERTTPIDVKPLAPVPVSQAACLAHTQINKIQELAVKEAEQDELQSKNLQQMPQLKGKDEDHPNRKKNKKKNDNKKKKKASQAAGQAEVCKLPEAQAQLNQQLQGAHGKLAAKEGLVIQQLACSTRGQQHQVIDDCNLAAAAQAALRPVAVVSCCSSTDESQIAAPGTPELGELSCSCPRSTPSSSSLGSPSSSHGSRSFEVQHCATGVSPPVRRIVGPPWMVAALLQRRQCC